MILATSADALSVAAYNALLFCPKSPLWAMALVAVDLSSVSILTTDGYALSSAPLPGTVTPSDRETALKITRDDLIALEAKARAGKKELVSLLLDPGEGVEYRGEDPSLNVRWRDVYEDSHEEEKETWDEVNNRAFTGLIKERAGDPSARAVILDTEYLGKLRQMKKPKGLGAGLWFSGPGDPVLARVGAHKVIIEPIDPIRHIDVFGDEAAW